MLDAKRSGRFTLPWTLVSTLTCMLACTVSTTLSSTSAAACAAAAAVAALTAPTAAQAQDDGASRRETGAQAEPPAAAAPATGSASQGAGATSPASGATSPASGATSSAAGAEAPAAAPGTAAAAPSGAAPRVGETIQVTATRLPEDLEMVPASITVISGEELRDRGVTDLAGALASVAGVAIAPAGDAGPASYVPELWGLREFDAFLLVVDGVPWGGTFNPALSALDITNVERIEVLRGSAPVMYGATSFVGVIQVIHRAAGAPGSYVRAGGGSYGTALGEASTALPALGGGAYQQSLTVKGENQGLRDSRAGWDREHLLYRGSLKTEAGGLFHLDLDGMRIHQEPGSPRPTDANGLSPLVPPDLNFNFLGAGITDERYHLATGWDQKLVGLGNASWSTTLAATHTLRGTARGFLVSLSNDAPNSHGFFQHLVEDDLYFDSHLAFDLGAGVRLLAGVDHLYGRAHNASEDFDYFVNLDASNPPRGADLPPQGQTDLKDNRNFSGLYVQGEWDPTARWHFQVGARLNHTRESLVTTSINLPAAATAAEATAPGAAAAAPKDAGGTGPGSDQRTVTRGSGAAGASFLAWQQGAGGVWVYADYRDTFKPAALDFGPDVSGQILKPETAHSVEAGLKGRHLDGRFDWELSLFQMYFSNLVVSQITPDGSPTLVNAGKERFRGGELEAEWSPIKDLRLQGTYSLHDARYTDFLASFGGGPVVQVAGNQRPLAARNMGALGASWMPRQGIIAWTIGSWVGKRFLDEQNTQLTPSYFTWSAGIGYRFGPWELRVDGQNLNDTRPPIAASELGDGEYYLLPARSILASAVWRR
jgi:iron complex outermembrane receptor protein